MYCTSHYRGQIIDDKYCEHLPKDSLERACNTHECPKWQFGDESAVSSHSQCEQITYAQSCCPHQANVSLNDHLTNLQFFFLNSLDHAQNSQQMNQSHRTILESQLWLIIFLIIKCSVSFICVMHSQIIIAVWKKIASVR